MGEWKPILFPRPLIWPAGASASRSATPRLSGRLKKLHTHSYSTVFGAIQDAAIAALNLPAERIAQLTAVYHQRREWVLRRLAALRWPARDAQGTFFLWLGVPPGYRSQEFARLLLQEANILVAPGTGFGAGGEGFIRISLTAGDEALSNALDRLARLALF